MSGKGDEMAKIEVPTIEAANVSERSEHKAAQKLDDATYEPRSIVARTGDYKQSEAIQASFTAVVNTATTAHSDLSATKASAKDSGSEGGGLSSPGVPTNGNHGPVGWEPTHQNQDSPKNKTESGSVSMQGTEARNTVRGQQPQIVKGVFEKKQDEDGGSGELVTTPIIPLPPPRLGILKDGGNGGENITAVNPPAVRDQGQPAHAPWKFTYGEGTPGKVDPTTGMVVPPSGPGGSKSGEDTDSNSTNGPTANLATGEERPGPHPQSDGVRISPPPQVERPESPIRPMQTPLDQGVTGTPTLNTQETGPGTESHAPVGPQEIDGGRLAREANDAIGVGRSGLLGGKAYGAQGVARGYGPGAPESGMPSGPSTGESSETGYHSSGGGAPV